MAGVKLDSRGWLEQPSLGQMSVYGVVGGLSSLWAKASARFRLKNVQASARRLYLPRRGQAPAPMQSQVVRFWD